MLMFNHHAYLIPHGADCRDSFFAHLEERGVTMHGNPDFFEIVTDVLSIDEARQLTERQLRKPFGDTVQVFVVMCNHVTHEAQNALLKAFEEPTKDSVFFLLTPHTHTLIPTLLSRLEHYELPEKREHVESVSAKEFLAAMPSKRLAMVKPIIEEKNKESALILLNSIEVILGKRVGEFQHVLAELENVRKYMHDRASSLKLLLESTALMCPIVGTGE